MVRDTGSKIRLTQAHISAWPLGAALGTDYVPSPGSPLSMVLNVIQALPIRCSCWRLRFRTELSGETGKHKNVHFICTDYL